MCLAQNLVKNPKDCFNSPVGTMKHKEILFSSGKYSDVYDLHSSKVCV